VDAFMGILQMLSVFGHHPFFVSVIEEVLNKSAGFRRRWLLSTVKVHALWFSK